MIVARATVVVATIIADNIKKVNKDFSVVKEFSKTKFPSIGGESDIILRIPSGMMLRLRT